jgi:hypothetical protein
MVYLLLLLTVTLIYYDQYVVALGFLVISLIMLLNGWD